MGSDKALLPFRGGKLAQWVARAVSEAAGSALGYPVIAEALDFQNVNTPEEWSGHAAG
jgi:molybdopterin-guanine dinucleotide biosynthesis protein A